VRQNLREASDQALRGLRRVGSLLTMAANMIRDRDNDDSGIVHNVIDTAVYRCFGRYCRCKRNIHGSASWCEYFVDLTRTDIPCLATIISDRNFFISITSPSGDLQFFLHSSHISDGRLPLIRVSTRSIGGGSSGGSRSELSHCSHTRLVLLIAL
jgi:hypothetical protein